MSDRGKTSGNLRGQTIGKILLERKLGQGGMGEVWLGRHQTLNIQVAVKLLPPHLSDRSEFTLRFTREAQTAALLNHPNIVRVLDCGAEGGRYYLTMEYVDGASIQKYIRTKGALNERQALKVAQSVALALGEAFKQKIVHRDIKPDNILMTRDGQIKLADLGLAKATDDDMSATTTGMAMGTPYYMSPEQAMDAKGVDGRSDIYSLGATLYHLVTGRPPYEGSSPYAIIDKHARDPIPDPRQAVPSLSEGFAHLIGWLMAKKAADRPQSPGDVLRAISKVLQGTPLGVGNTFEPASAYRSGETAPTIATGAATQPTIIIREHGIAQAFKWAAVLTGVAGAVLLTAMFLLKKKDPPPEKPPVEKTEAAPEEIAKTIEPPPVNASATALIPPPEGNLDLGEDYEDLYIFSGSGAENYFKRDFRAVPEGEILPLIRDRVLLVAETDPEIGLLHHPTSGVGFLEAGVSFQIVHPATNTPILFPLGRLDGKSGKKPEIFVLCFQERAPGEAHVLLTSTEENPKEKHTTASLRNLETSENVYRESGKYLLQISLDGELLRVQVNRKQVLETRRLDLFSHDFRPLPFSLRVEKSGDQPRSTIKIREIGINDNWVRRFREEAEIQPKPAQEPRFEKGALRLSLTGPTTLTWKNRPLLLLREFSAQITADPNLLIKIPLGLEKADDPGSVAAFVEYAPEKPGAPIGLLYGFGIEAGLQGINPLGKRTRSIDPPSSGPTDLITLCLERQNRADLNFWIENPKENTLIPEPITYSLRGADLLSEAGGGKLKEMLTDPLRLILIPPLNHPLEISIKDIRLKTAAPDPKIEWLQQRRERGPGIGLKRENKENKPPKEKER